MTPMLEAVKMLATQETPSDDEAIEAMIADCGGDVRVAAMSLLKISRVLAFELHVMTELRCHDHIGRGSH